MTVATLLGWWRGRRTLRALVLFLYYLGVIAALLWLYGGGDFKTAPFIYQGF